MAGWIAAGLFFNADTMLDGLDLEDEYEFDTCPLPWLTEKDWNE